MFVSARRLPSSLIGFGLLLGVVMSAELLAVVVSPEGLQVVWVVNFIATVPFLGILVGGGYWLAKSEVPTERYRRIAGWVVVCFVFLVGFFMVIALFTQDELLARVSIVRWAAAAGAGVGTLVGIFEARAIERALVAERTRIRNEELERKNEHLEDFARILTHDLRNPLSVAHGWVDLLREEYDDEHLDKIARAHERMNRIIEETLLLARSGQSIGETETVALSDFAFECWRNIPTEEATLTIESGGSITADPSRFEHLFENLFRNAIEHGGSDANVRVGTLSDGFFVEDDGPGIPEEEREELFQSGYTTKDDGTGFGLAIVREIVDAHGWNISVETGADGGARFEVTGVEIGGSGPSSSTATTQAALH